MITALVRIWIDGQGYKNIFCMSKMCLRAMENTDLLDRQYSLRVTRVPGSIVFRYRTIGGIIILKDFWFRVGGFPRP